MSDCISALNSIIISVRTTTKRTQPRSIYRKPNILIKVMVKLGSVFDSLAVIDSVNHSLKYHRRKSLSLHMRGSRKFCQRGSNTDFFFFFFFSWWVRERIEISTKSRPSSARQRNAIEKAFRRRVDNAGLVERVVALSPFLILFTV